MSIPIDKDKPAPARTPRSYPFHEMSYKDSFFVAPGKGQSVRNVQSSIGASAKRRGYKVITRQVTEGGTDGVRCWFLGKLKGASTTQKD